MFSIPSTWKNGPAVDEYSITFVSASGQGQAYVRDAPANPVEIPDMIAGITDTVVEVSRGQHPKIANTEIVVLEIRPTGGKPMSLSIILVPQGKLSGPHIYDDGKKYLFASFWATLDSPSTSMTKEEISEMADAYIKSEAGQTGLKIVESVELQR